MPTVERQGMAAASSSELGPIEEIIALVQDYLPEKDQDNLRQAYLFALALFAGQKRIDGTAYIEHPLAICRYLARMRLDGSTLIAGLLHSACKEPYAVTKEELTKRFGADAAKLIEGSTRITKLKFTDKLTYQAENVRKLFVAMAADIRVLLVRLTDRLHDMQTMPVGCAWAWEVARETMDIYAPLASRLGVDWMKRELEDRAFAYLHPEEYADLIAKTESSHEESMAFVEEIKKILHNELLRHDLANFRVLGRPKHLYSIYRKLVSQKISFDKVYDKVAFRIILHTVGECYEALGIVHSLWTPVASRYKDFISSPKANMYQSLHTSVVGPRGGFMEIQIRTEEMDRIANDGIAAHWAYKEQRAISRKDAKFFEWLKQLVQGIQELDDPRELLEAVKGELQQEEMYVLTPKGDIKELKAGSTPLDFAYSVHTEVGHHCTGAKVNGRIVPLKYQLQNGDVIEILTSPNHWPKRGWLAIVKTPRAKGRIRQWLKQDEQEKCLKMGREICERELRAHNLSLKKIIKTGHLKELLKRFNANSLDEFLLRVGRGQITVAAILQMVLPPEMQETAAGGEEERAAAREFAAPGRRGEGKKKKGDTVLIDGVDGMLIFISHCCMPVPGDDIMGFITAGRGVSVHKTTCPNILHADPQRRIGVEWAAFAAVQHRTSIVVIAQSRKGFIAALSNTITAEDANIVSMEARTDENHVITINTIVEVTGRDHLETLMQHIRKMGEVIQARRQ